MSLSCSSLLQPIDVSHVTRSLTEYLVFSRLWNSAIRPWVFAFGYAGPDVSLTTQATKSNLKVVLKITRCEGSEPNLITLQF